MHDIDRTQTEFEPEMETLESDQFEFSDESEPLGELETESPFDEVEEMELAAELLEVTDESELDQFLGGLIKKAGRAAGKFVKSPVGQALGGVLKNAARKYLPIAGGALGNILAPGIGGMVGSQLASRAGKMFGLELEGLSPEDQEFEVARRYVRFAGAAAKNAAQTPSAANPQAAARAAITSAARRHAPGLVGGGGSSSNTVAPHGSRNSGRWIRRGRKIVLFGV